MIISDITVQLKNGVSACIRSPRADDVPGMLDYLYKTAQETEFIIRYPEECSKYTPEGELAFIDRANSDPNTAMLVCLVEGVLVGTAQILWTGSIKTRHRATVAVAILKEYWGLGIGTAFFEIMFDIAQKNPNILQLELDFIEGNSRARALYEKMGFRITGVKPNAIRLKDGTLLNEYSMVLPLPR